MPFTTKIDLKETQVVPQQKGGIEPRQCRERILTLDDDLG